MTARHRSMMVFAASQLVVLAAVIHLFLGAQKWGQYASYGIIVPPDVRWPLFVVSGLAVIAGIALARRSSHRRRWYLAGAAVMLGYVAAYFLWHLAGHRPLFVLGPATHHPLTPEFVLAHYIAGPLETFTLTIELVAAALLAILAIDAEP